MFTQRLLRTGSSVPVNLLRQGSVVRSARMSTVARRLPAFAGSLGATRPVRATYTPVRFYSGPAPLTKEFVLERVTGVLSNCDKISPEKITPDARLEEDLGLDSLDVVDALFFVEEEFTVQMPDHEADALKTVQDVVDWVYAQHDAV